LTLLASRLSTAVQAARAALEPVSLTVGRANAPGMTLNRRPMYAGGEVACMGPVDVDEFVRLEGPADDEVQVLQAVRADGSVAGGLVGFACHPLMLGLSEVYSSDYHGALVRRLAEQHKAIFLYVQGAEGDLQPPLWADPRAREAHEQGDPAGMRRLRDEYVEGLLAVSEQARAASSPVCGVPVRSASEVIEIDQRSPTREQVDLAYWYLRQDPETVDDDEFNRKMTGHAYTHWGNPYQEWFAREAIGMWWAHRGGTCVRPEQIEVQVIALGDVAFVAYPAEMFAEFGLRTKDESPFARTFVCGLANGWFGYVPTSEAFSHGGYETRMAYTSRLVPSAGDRMTETALRLLNTVAQPPER
jgi:neutral ceramidase